MYYLDGPRIISRVLVKDKGRGKRVRERAMRKGSESETKGGV